MRILLVEDSARLSTWLAKALEQGGYAVDQSFDGIEADMLLATEQYDAVILDLELPSLDGLGVLRRLRSRGTPTPVIVLTARSGLDDRIMGLNVGADDYIVKPFELGELEARLHAVIRRAHGIVASTLSMGSLSYDSDGRLFTLDGRTLSLRPKEHAVLEVLLLRGGRPITKEQLFEKMFSADATTGQDVVEIYIHRLRRQLTGSNVAIVTMRGLGYLLEAA